ncbi:OLC1v1031221C1 [Oldenlandia corymbosa var. corymbosa]|uniref:OLC1v1031221C1 n=1 Tax=Oldenlandia corymbosa var. corymbosa TaxID=529605 RepID=A0AAV1CIX5_OLDCO|nr:OLC1v1031221C1 [Oldenlandia corymbosa var. corymbosa]
MERGESSTPPSNSSVSNDNVWAKLVPSDSRYSDIELTSNETLVCSEISISSSGKSEWCRITRNMDLVSATFHNRRGNKVLVDEIVVRGDDTAVIRCGSEIIPGFSGDGEGLLRYRFKVMPAQESDKKQLNIVLDAEHAKCSICLNVWHDVVTVAPCLHNFCNGCFSEWLRRSQEKRADVLCPQCRSVVQFVGRNHFLHGIEEDLLQADDSLRRSAEEIAVLDSYASIRSPLVMSTSRRKRSRSVPDNENREVACRQCATEFAGYKCNPSTVHLQCHGCGGMMPSRTNNVPQQCLGCDRAFCGAYWHAQGVARGDAYPICSPETFQPIAERITTRMPFWVHEKNRHEQDITESCIQRMGSSLQDVISEWVTKMENQELDRTFMQLNHAELITARTHTCNDCYGKIVSFLLYWFRITMPMRFLSPEASQREDCWYGYACRTQHHNEEHARKRNHVCRPTRGTHR